MISPADNVHLAERRPCAPVHNYAACDAGNPAPPRQFEILGISARHVAIARTDYPEVFRSVRGVRIIGRLLTLLRGLLALRRELKALDEGDIVYVNALDCLVATICARALSTGRLRLVCQILDVHLLLIYPGIWRTVLRPVERWALRHLDLLIVPTNGNITGYYRPVALYHGPAAVVHNTLPTGEVPAPLPAAPYHGVWTIGWLGSLRCERTLAILCNTAQLLGPKVRIVMAGTDKLPAGLLARSIGPHTNMVYVGPFQSRRDAAALYADVHIACGLHFNPPRKWKWMLAVRILEAGAYGRPAIAPAEADMGRFVADNDIGWAISEPIEEKLPQLLRELTWETYCAKVQVVRDKPGLFVGEDQLVAALASLTRA